MDIYKHEKYLKRAEERVQEADYPENNKKLIFKFENHLFIRGYETPRVLKYQDIAVQYNSGLRNQVH